MKVIHWSMKNGSGMHHVAASMARAELAMGVESRCMDPFDKEQAGWELALDADVHVSHTHIPETIGKHIFRRSVTKPYRWVFPVHGTPELVFESSVRDAEQNGYNSGTSYEQHQWGMQQADAVWAFVPRHQWLYKMALDRRTFVDLIPMGIDVEFWKAEASLGKYAGTPSFLNYDNQYPFKWGIEAIKWWQAVREELDLAVFHCLNIPTGVLPFAKMMLARYGARGIIAGNWQYPHDQLRKIVKSCDFYLSLVRYGDFNRASLEAAAAGVPVISFPGNPYASYYVAEGDQRALVRDLIAIGRGDLAPLAHAAPPTEADMAKETINCYERLLDRPRTNWAVGEVLPDALPENVRTAIISGQEMDSRVRTGPRPIQFTADEEAAMAGEPAAPEKAVKKSRVKKKATPSRKKKKA